MNKSLYTSFVLCTLLLCTLLCACSDESTLDLAGMFSPNGETVNTRFAQSQQFNASRPDMHIDMSSDNYTVYVCTDSHITRKTHRNLDYFMAQYNAAAAPKLALHLGDLIDAQKNFACADSILHLGGTAVNETPSDLHPYSLFITPGNHDIYFKQWSVYRSCFNTSAYWFDTRNGEQLLDLFICLDSAEGTLGTMQMKWLRELLETKSKQGYRHIIVFTHTHLWKLDGSQGHTSNMAMEDTYELTSLLAQYGVEFVWSGHQHARQSVVFKGVNYLVLDATKDSESGQSYMSVEMGNSMIYHYHSYPSK